MALEGGSLASSLLRLFSQDGLRCVAMLEAFVDESGTHEGSPIISVALYAGSHENWQTFLSKWGNRVFHAKESGAEQRKTELFKAIEESHLEGVTVWVKPQDFQDHTTHRFKATLGNPYAVCTFICAMGICNWARDKNMGKVAFVLEHGQPNLKWVKSVLENMMERGKFGIASVATANKHEFIQLGAADFLAHSRTSDPDWYKKLYETNRVSDGHLKPDTIKQICRQIEEGLSAMKRKKREAREYERFAALVDGVLRVPHAEVKAKLDAEKKAKKRRKEKHDN